jgi:PIN domain nuclease of toxin-antitoxin system
VIVLDAYALVAFLADEGPAAEVEELLNAEVCAISVVNLAEAGDVSARVRGLVDDDVRSAVRVLVATERLHLRDARVREAWRAAELRRTYYAKRTCEISLGDCFLVAGADRGDQIATADPAVATVARAEGLPVVALADSTGRKP